MTEEEQAELMQQIQEEHLESPHEGLGGEMLRLHVAIHTVVETQVRDGRPAETARTLQRLTDAGVGRHDAVHAIGHVVSEELLASISGRDTRYDEVRFVNRLRGLVVTGDPPTVKEVSNEE